MKRFVAVVFLLAVSGYAEDKPVEPQKPKSLILTAGNLNRCVAVYHQDVKAEKNLNCPINLWPDGRVAKALNYRDADAWTSVFEVLVRTNQECQQQTKTLSDALAAREKKDEPKEETK